MRSAANDASTFRDIAFRSSHVCAFEGQMNDARETKEARK